MLKKLFNPTSEDLTFTYDSAPYTVKAGQSENFIAHIAILGAKKLAEREAMTNDPEEAKVLGHAYLENSDPEVIAKNLGIDLSKIREEAMTKEKEKARVVNLESQILEQGKKIEALVGLVERGAVENTIGKDEEANTRGAVDPEETNEEVKVDKRTKEYKANKSN